MDNKIVHHYLHEQAFGTVVAERIDANTVSCLLEDREYHLSVNERDQRTMIVFDGELLFGGLPKSGTVIQSNPLRIISCPTEAVRKNPKYSCEAMPKYHETERKTAIWISRHFLLLPSCTAIVRKFRDKSLSPIYVIINVSMNSKGTRVVEWQTTSY